MKGRLFLLFFLVHQVIGVKISHDCLYGNALALQCCKDVPDRKDVILRVPGDCASYYVCVVGLPVLLNCPSGYHWNVEKQICILPELSNCTNSQTNPNAPSQLSTIKPSKNLQIGKKRLLKPTSLKELEIKIKEDKEMSDLGLKENERFAIKSKLRKGLGTNRKERSDIISKPEDRSGVKFHGKWLNFIKRKSTKKPSTKKTTRTTTTEAYFPIHLCRSADDHLLCGPTSGGIGSSNEESNEKERSDIKSKSKERSGVKFHGKWINIFKRKSTRKSSTKKTTRTTTTEAYTGIPIHRCRSTDYDDCGPTSGEIGSSNMESNEKKTSDIKSEVIKERSDARKMVDNLKKNH